MSGEAEKMLEVVSIAKDRVNDAGGHVNQAMTQAEQTQSAATTLGSPEPMAYASELVNAVRNAQAAMHSALNDLQTAVNKANTLNSRNLLS